MDSTDFTRYPARHKYSVADTHVNFEHPEGPFKMLEGGDVGEALTEIDEGAIKAAYGAGKILGTETGFSFFDVPVEGSEQAWMSYRVKFSDGFEWTKGGKLPGLCGGPDDGSGRTCPTGCSPVTHRDGFSARLMWRQGGSLVTYAYYPDKPSSIRCGEDWVWDTTIVSGKWYEISMRLTLNSVRNGRALADGRFEAWLDGRKTLDRRDIRFRDNGRVVISRAYLTSYVGGSSVSMFAPSKDQYALFDTFRAGVGGVVGACGVAPSMPAGTRDPGNTRFVAPQRLFDFHLYNGGSGWDAPGNYIRYRTPRASKNVYGKLRYCHGKCKHSTPCRAFTVYGNGCYLKNATHVERTTRWYGNGRRGSRWYYVRQLEGGDVLDQSASLTEACGDVGQTCCYADARSNGAPLCSSGTCQTPTASDGNDPVALACLCSDSFCVKNIEYCPENAVCDQSKDLTVCGGLDQPCCGISCDEDATISGKTVALECIEASSAPTCRPLTLSEKARVPDQTRGP